MGYQGLQTGHGIRGTLSTALNDQQIRHERRSGLGTVVAELAGQTTEGQCTCMTDHIGDLETDQGVFVHLIASAVPPPRLVRLDWQGLATHRGRSAEP